MFALQRDLAAAIPDAAELALLRSVLEGTRGSENMQTSQLKSTWRYTETVDLAPALLHWNEIAAGLEYAPADPLEEAPDMQSEELQRVQRVLQMTDAAAWRRFAANSRVNFRFEQSISDTNQEWQVGPGSLGRCWFRSRDGTWIGSIGQESASVLWSWGWPRWYGDSPEVAGSWGSPQLANWHQALRHHHLPRRAAGARRRLVDGRLGVHHAGCRS